jgi:hypothetical protein
VAGRDHARTIPFGCDHSATARLVLRWATPSTMCAPTSRNGADRKSGRLRNIAASIDTSACRRTGTAVGQQWLIVVGSDRLMILSRCRAATNSSPFEHAGKYITKLPKAEHQAPEWQAAMEALILVVTLGGPTMFARIGFMRALNRHVERAE